MNFMETVVMETGNNVWGRRKKETGMEGHGHFWMMEECVGQWEETTGVKRSEWRRRRRRETRHTGAGPSGGEQRGGGGGEERRIL